MESSSRFLLLFLFFLPSPFVSSTSIPGDVFAQSQSATGRTLLQQKTECPINFETLNYTDVTSLCKGPNFNAETCCKGFKFLACPYADLISDLKNNCAKTLFSYINLYGKYPPGLFSSLCVEGGEGLQCEETNKELKARNSTSSSESRPDFHYHSSSFLLIIATTFFLILSPFNLLFI